MRLWDIGDGVDTKTVIAWCTRDREDLAADFFFARPEFEGQPAALWLELFLDFCGVKVHDCRLASGQLGLCDIKERIIFVNSRMHEFVHHKTNLTALRTSTLAHELGHLRLHDGEDTDQVYVSSYRQGKMLRHPRAYQREREADLYGALFLVPLKELKAHKSAATIRIHRRERRVLSNATIWKMIYRIAGDFHVSPTLIRRCLVELGWIESVNQKAGYKESLRLKLK